MSKDLVFFVLAGLSAGVRSSARPMFLGFGKNKSKEA
jgi:hypothetical protein